MGRALVTGAAQGIGLAIARRLCADGFEVVLADLDAARVAAVAAELGSPGADVDVRDPVAVAELAAGIESLDVLVNNAGIWRKGSLVDATDSELREVLDVNVMGTVNCTRAFVPLLQAAPRPAIVNVSSGAARSSSPNLGTYPASKAAVESLTRQWALELAPIRVNAVAPGLVVTEGTSANYEGEAGRLRAKAVPLGRVGEPDDVADVIAFLVSDQARYVSGQVISVDGGLSAGVGAR